MMTFQLSKLCVVELKEQKTDVNNKKTRVCSINRESAMNPDYIEFYIIPVVCTTALYIAQDVHGKLNFNWYNK